MNKQEIFYKAYTAVSRQQVKSQRGQQSCAYFGNGGTRCAIGHLITEKLAKAWDRRRFTNIEAIKGTKANPVPDWVKENLSFLVEVQRCHDCTEETHGLPFVAEFQQRMREVAAKHDLVVPEFW